MKRHFAWMPLVAMLLLMPACANALETDTKGAEPGKWTMDLDAAVKIANNKKLPILLNFSGSDWCGWCKIMEKNVFGKKEWNDYAKDSMMMVLLDFPKDSTLVPEKYVKRNEEIQTQYNVEGFPTFILLDDDGNTVLGRLGAGRDKTPESFIGELATLSRYRDAEVEKFLKTLKPESRSEYKAIVDGMSKTRLAIANNEEQIQTAQKTLAELEEESLRLLANAQEFRAAQLGAKELKEYQALKIEADEAVKELAEWITGSPERTESNMTKYQSMSERTQELQEKLSKY